MKQGLAGSLKGKSCDTKRIIPVSPGEVAERLNAPVLKTGKARAFEGSNPSLSANVQTGPKGPCVHW